MCGNCTGGGQTSSHRKECPGDTRPVDARFARAAAEKQPGEAGYLKPVLDSKGVPKVMSPEMLAGLLMEMGSGDKTAPKGRGSEPRS